MPFSTKCTLLIVTSLCIAGAEAFARACQFSDQGAVPVVYFGGASSTDEQCQAWASAAQRSERYGRHFRFEGHGLKGRGLEEPLRIMAADIQACVEKIESTQFRGPIVLVAHSNGSVIINKIVQQTSPAARSKIKIVNLDGSLPSAGRFFEQVEVQCWTAQVPRSKIEPGPKPCTELQPNALTSDFVRVMRQCPAASCFFWIDHNCRTPVCLHFRVINRQAANDLTWSTFRRSGYAEIDPPLDYLERYLPREGR